MFQYRRTCQNSRDAELNSKNGSLKKKTGHLIYAIYNIIFLRIFISKDV